MSEEKLDLVSREQALRVARMLGCQGAHETEKGWMPCGSHEEYEAIKKGKEEYLKVLASKKKKPLPKMVQRTKRLETKSDAYYENRADALSISKIRGCGGVRTVMLAGKRYYTPCDHKPRKGWEKLDEKPITGIATLPGGGLVSGSFSGKSAEDNVEEKGFVNFVSRSTDPDTFSDPESARIRSRNLGCIGIRRYTARDGKLVWMPCTNVSDYNRVTGIRGDNSPRNNPRRQGAGFKKKTLGDPIGGSVASSGNKPIDGDGDGFIASTPGGVDDTRVSPKQEKRPKGEITKGNIDLNNRPVVKNRDRSISTVRSITITEGNTAVVIPTVIKKPNGSGVIVGDQQAIRHYQRSGQHLGKFSNIRDADTYAQNLHNQQAVQYPNSGKSLGTPIGVKPSEENVDGDGDGFTTGGIVGGEDKIPVVPTQILEHAGSPFLKNFEKQKSDLEKKFGDLRNVKNATKAFKKTFPRLKSFDLFDEEGENFSSEYNFARAITLLHLGQDKRVADTISDIGFIDGDDSKHKDTTALCAVGLIDKNGTVFISHAIHFNKSVKSTPQSGGGRVYDGWGDGVAKQMKEQNVPQSEIDKFWSMYVANHEWTHAEHNVAMFEQHDLKLDAEVYDMARFAFPNLSDDEFDARVKTAVELTRKENGSNWGLLVSDDQRRQQVLQKMIIVNRKQLESQLAKGYRNDLQKGEVSQLEGNYPSTVSGYAAENFNELVAEKGSAYRMGHSAGSPNNPAWRKLLKFVRGGMEIENDIPNREGMTRQQRRALERAQAKLKKNLEDLPFGIDWGKVKPVSLESLPKENGFISIFGQCEGFTYYLKDVQDGGKSKTKTLNESTPKGMSEGMVLFKGVPKARKKPPTVTSTDINNLAIRVRQHNAKAKPAQRANLRDLKNVYLRGLEGGDKSSANKRISKFLSLLMSDKPKDVKYFDDNDLLPLDHPWRNRKTTKKWAGFDDGEYGVKYAEKCCPQVVKRYHAK